MNTPDLPIIRVAGPPFERGKAYGATAKKAIRSLSEVWMGKLQAERGEDPIAYIKRFLSDTGHLGVLRERAPDLYAEIQGVAEGADLDFQLVAAQNLIDEEWAYARRNGVAAAHEAGGRCSALAVKGDGARPTRIGQNLDMPAYYDGWQTVLIIDHGAFRVAVFATGGCVALCGMSSRGVGICCNALQELNAAKAGLPVFAVVRSALEQASAADARTLLQSIPHASGQNYVFGDRNNVYSIECSADSTAPFEYELADRVFHTNHAFVNTDDDQMREVLGAESSRDERCASPTTFGRYDALTRRLGAPHSAVDLDAIKAALSSQDDPDAPVSRAGDPDSADAKIGFTAASVVYEMVDDPVLHIAPGPPDKTPYRAIAIE